MEMGYLALFLYVIIELGLGVMSCFWGKKFFYPMIAVFSFFVAYETVTTMVEETWIGLLIAIGIALLVAIFVKVLFKVGMFLIGAMCGLLVGVFVMAMLPTSLSSLSVLIILILTIALAVLAVIFSDFFVMLSTAFSGASMIAYIGCFLGFNATQLNTFISNDFIQTLDRLNNAVNGPMTMAENIVFTVATIALIVCGILVQRNQEGPNTKS